MIFIIYKSDYPNPRLKLFNVFNIKPKLADFTKFSATFNPLSPLFSYILAMFDLRCLTHANLTQMQHFRTPRTTHEYQALLCLSSGEYKLLGAEPQAPALLVSSSLTPAMFK